MILILDIETTGLDPVKDQIIQFGCIAYDPEKNRIIDTMQVGLVHERISGNYYALDMNVNLLDSMLRAAKRIYAGESVPGWLKASEFKEHLFRWLVNQGFEVKDGNISITACGKNAASFDVPFIKNTFDADTPLTYVDGEIRFRHRVLDIGSIMYDPKLHGSTLPDLSTCLRLAGWPGDVAHTAIQDCEAVLHCLRFKYHGIKGPYDGEEVRPG